MSAYCRRIQPLISLAAVLLLLAAQTGTRAEAFDFEALQREAESPGKPVLESNWLTATARPIFEHEKTHADGLLVGDRFIYLAGDGWGQFYLMLAEAEGFPDGHRAQLKLIDQGTSSTAKEVTTDVLDGRKLHMLLHVDALKPARYVLQASLLNGDGKAVGDPLEFAFERSSKQREAIEFPADGVSLEMPDQTYVKRDMSWPTHAGVPLPIGAVRNVDELALLENGKPVAADIRPASTWGPNNTLKWVHIHFNAKYENGKPAKYRLIRSGATKPAQPATPLRVATKGDLITVDNGYVKFQVNQSRFGGIEKAWVNASGEGKYNDERPIVSGAAGPYLVSHRLIRYDAKADENVRVVIEEQSASRVVIRAEGWYVNPTYALDKLCKFKTRITAVAGSPMVRVSHQTTLTYDTHAVRLADLGFDFAMPAAETFTVGIDGKSYDGKIDPQSEAEPFIHQDRHDRVRLVATTDQPIAGKKSDGWFAAWVAEAAKTSKIGGDDLGADFGDLELFDSFAAPGLAVLLKDVWQKFPKEVSFGDPGITVHFWPKHGHRAYELEDELKPANVYKFLCFHQNRMMNLALPDDYFDMLDAHPDTFECLASHALNGNAQGLVISNDMMLRFTTGVEKDELGGWASLHQQDPPAFAPRDYNAATDAMGPMAAADYENFGDIEESFEKGFLSYTKSVERGEAYGMFNYADTHTYWDAKNNHAKLHRVWHNSHYHEAGLTWLMLFRTGSRDLLEWARKSTDHYINIDTIHYATRVPRPNGRGEQAEFMFHSPGSMYHCKGLAHWGSEAYGMERHDTHANQWGHWVDPDASLWCWLLDANPHARDTHNMWVASGQIFGLPTRGTRREINNTLAMVVNAYEQSWNADLLPSIHGTGRSLREDEPLADQNPGPMWHPMWMNRYYRLTRDARYIDFVLEHASNTNIKDTWILGLSALGHEFSGDAEKYLAQHYQRLLELPLRMYHKPGDSYDWFGEGPGPLGFRWSTFGWPLYLKQLKAAGLTKLPDWSPSGGTYLWAKSRGAHRGAGINVYALAETDQPVTFKVQAYSFGGDLHQLLVRGFDPSERLVHNEGPINDMGVREGVPFTFKPDAMAGLYRAELRSYEAAVTLPLFDVNHEASLLMGDVSYWANRLNAYLLPRQNDMLIFTMKGRSDRDPCNVRLLDANGKLIKLASMFQPRETGDVVFEVDPAEHPAPWRVIGLGLVSISFDLADKRPSDDRRPEIWMSPSPQSAHKIEAAYAATE